MHHASSQTSALLANIVSVGSVAATIGPQRSHSAIDYHIGCAERAATRGDWQAVETNAASAAWRLADTAYLESRSEDRIGHPAVRLSLQADGRGQGAHRSLLRRMPTWHNPSTTATICLTRAHRSLLANRPLIAAAWTGAAAVLACQVRGGNTSEPYMGLDTPTGRGVRVGAEADALDERAATAIEALRAVAHRPLPATGQPHAEAVMAMVAWSEECDRLVAGHMPELLRWIDRTPDGTPVWNHLAPALYDEPQLRPRPQLVYALAAPCPA